MNGPLRLAPDGRAWLRDGVPWTAPRPFLAVLGRPVGGSLSPVIQTAALRAADIGMDYHLLEAGPEELDALLDAGHALGLRGFNVTMPCKAAAATRCRGMTPEAQAVGAVNTVRVEADAWFGHNTDVGGLLEVIREATQQPPALGLVLGAGGAARAAVLALLRCGADRVRVLARTGERTAAFARWLPGLPGDAAVAPWGTSLGSLLSTGDDVVVSCVPPGVDEGVLLHGTTPLRPALWLDLRYGLTRPPALAALDPPWRDGRGLLLAQGALSFAWWFDRPAPRAAMAAALDAP